MIPKQKITIGSPKNNIFFKTINIICKILFYSFFFSPLLLFDYNLFKLVISSISIIGVVFLIIKYILEFDTIGEILLFDNFIQINENSNIIEYNFDQVSKIIFTFNQPKDAPNLRLPISYNGFQNKITIITHKKKQFYIFCTDEIYDEIRSFCNENKEKFKIRLSFFI